MLSRQKGAFNLANPPGFFFHQLKEKRRRRICSANLSGSGLTHLDFRRASLVNVQKHVVAIFIS